MSIEGFEVELVLAMKKLINGEALDTLDLQVINCAESGEKTEAFEKVVSEILDNEVKVNNFKSNLSFIESIRNNLDPVKFKCISRGCAGIQMMLEKVMYKLLIGNILDEKEMAVVAVADDFDLAEAFRYAQREILSQIDFDVSEIFNLYMYYLKSLRLLGKINVFGEEVTSIKKEKMLVL